MMRALLGAAISRRSFPFCRGIWATSVPVSDGFVGVCEVRERFPCPLMVAVSFPFDEIFYRALRVGALSLNGFDFVLVFVLDADWWRSKIFVGSAVFLEMYD